MTKQKIVVWVGIVIVFAAILTTSQRVKKTNATTDLAYTLCVNSLITNYESRAARIKDGTMTNPQLAASLASQARLSKYCAIPDDYMSPIEIAPTGATGQ